MTSTEKLSYGYDLVGNVTRRQVAATWGLNARPGREHFSQVYQYDGLHRLVGFDRGKLAAQADAVEQPAGLPFAQSRQWQQLDMLGNWKSTKSTVNGAESTDVRTVNEVILDTSQRLCRGPLAQDASVRDESRIYYLKDMLGSVVALTDSNGLVVERYEYDPYGRTEVLTVTYMHDANLDGEIDASDEAHLNACLATEEMQVHPMCVFVHDIDSDGIVDLDDLSVFQGFDYTSNGPRPPAEWERSPTSLYDANNDKRVEMFDFYGFQVCFASTNSLCHYVFDANDDSQITLADYTTFLASYQRTAPTRTATSGASRFGNPFMWTGQRYDAAVGLYHFLFRSYSPEFGRWLQRDPLGYVDGTTFYIYALGMPTSLIDALGLDPDQA